MKSGDTIKPRPYVFGGFDEPLIPLSRRAKIALGLMYLCGLAISASLVRAVLWLVWA